MSSELTPQSDSMSAESLGLINGVANHEAKAVVTGIVASRPNEWFDMTHIHQAVRSAQTSENGWIPALPVPFKYFQQTLAPIGAVVKGSVESNRGFTVDAYKASEFGATIGLAAVGAVLGWSLDHPDVSVQELFSRSASKTASRAPMTRFAIYKSLLEAGDDGRSYGQIETDIAERLHGIKPDDTVKFIFNEPSNDKFFDVRSILRDYNPTFEIVHADYRGNKQLETFSPTVQAIYSALAQFETEGATTVTLDQLIEMTCGLTDGIERTTVRRKLVNMRQTDDIPSLRCIDGDGREVSKDTETIVKLKPAVRMPIANLVKRLDAALNDEPNSGLQDEARAIISSPRDIAILMRKARDFSPNHRATVREHSTQDLIKKVLQNNSDGTPLDLTQIQAQLHAIGEVYKRGTLTEAIKDLVGNGSIIAQDSLIRNDKLVTKRVFALAEPQDSTN